MRKRLSSYTAYALLLSIILCSSACVSNKQAGYYFNPKLSAAHATAEIDLLQKVLESNHPSMYWYTSKDSMDGYFQAAKAAIKDSISENQLKNVIGSVVSKIRCGHTSVRHSKAFNELGDKNRFPQFPLYFKVWDDSLVVLANAFTRDSVLKRGTIVTSINGQSNQQILSKIFDVISTDGYSNNYKNQVVSNNFPAWYKSVLGLDSSYTIEDINEQGNKAFTTIKNFAPIKDTSKKERPKTSLPPPPTAPTLSRRARKKAQLLAKRNMQIDTSINTAYIRLTTFSGSKLRKFFRQSFKTIEEKHLDNVVIDLRENGGGNVALSTKLTKYLINKPFKLADTVAAINRTFPYKKYIHPWFLYWFPMNFLSHKKGDGKIHFTRYEKHFYQPQKKHHFDGQVYLIQGGITFSAATMFTSALKGQSNVTLVGEETGGGYYGNSAMHLLNIELPYSHIRIVLPMYRLVMDKNRPKGHGVMPDIDVKPSSVAIKKGVDIKLQTIRALILGKKKLG